MTNKSKDILKGVSILSFVLSLIGLSIAIRSVKLGYNAGNAWLSSNGGSADTNLFYMIIEGYMKSYLVTGAVIFVVGILVSICCMLVIMVNGSRKIDSD